MFRECQNELRRGAGPKAGWAGWAGALVRIH